MIVTLQNAFVKAMVKSRGAELCSFVLKDDNTEYIWQAYSAYWGRHAPVLFPIVGRLKGDLYSIDGKEYSLSQHGFARDAEFENISASNTTCAFCLSGNEVTRLKYPYDFNLIIGYSLKEQTLTISYTVVNLSPRSLYFSIGAHPAFNCPIVQGENMEAYFLQFNEKENPWRLTLLDGLISDETPYPLINDTILPLSPQLFHNDALIFRSLKSKNVTLASKTSSKFVKVNFAGFPYLGIWSKPDRAPFLCIEPWYGLADKFDSDQQLTKKLGIQKLEPQEVFYCNHSITIG